MPTPYKKDITLATPYTLPTTLVPEGRIVTICDEEDNYRFGFNGQEKVNEVAGIGNHYTALFWEYDTRLGRRWNLDPKPQISISDYAAFGNNPIWYNDVLGDIKNKNGTQNTEQNPETLNEVVIKPQKETPNPDVNATGGLFGGNGSMSLMQAAAQDIGRNDEGRRKVDQINTDIQVWMGIGAAPFAAIAGAEVGVGALFSMSTELWGTKALLSAGSQGLVNGWREIDFADVAGDAFTAPGLNALWSGGVDFKPFAERNQFRLHGIHNSKSASQFGIDAAIGFGFGKVSDATWKPLGSMLKSPTERSIFYISTQSAISVGQQGAGKVISNQQK